ncbi:hypothetical protein JCM16303_006084 [Sporobolomyces ruberrimus]
MSWSRSLRSPSSTPPPPPAPAPAPADVDIGSLWDNEGDRNDPIDIGSVWEPKVKFTETPFTIARRNAAKQPAATAQNVSGATKVNSTKPVPSTTSSSRSEPVPFRNVKPTTSPKALRSPTILAISSPSAQAVPRSKESVPSTEPLSQVRPLKQGWLSAPEVRSMPRVVEDVFYESPPTSSSTLTPSSIVPKELGKIVSSAPVQQDTNKRKVASENEGIKGKVEELSAKSRTNAVSVETQTKEKSFEIRQGKLPHLTILSYLTASHALEYCELPTSSAASPVPEGPKDPLISSSPIAASSSPLFQVYADSQGSPITADSSPPPTRATIAAILEPVTTRPELAMRPELEKGSNSEQVALKGDQEVGIIRPTPIRVLDSSSVTPAHPDGVSTAPETSSRFFKAQLRPPPPSFTEPTPSKVRGTVESEALRGGFSQTTRAKLDNFRNPRESKNAKGSVNSDNGLANQFPPSAVPHKHSSFIEPAYDTSPHQRFDSDKNAQEILPTRSPSRSAQASFAHLTPTTRRLPIAPSHSRSNSHFHPHSSSSTSASTSKFSLPLSIPKKRRQIDFLPLEPIESFQKRKGIVSTSSRTSESRIEQEEEGEGFWEGGRGFLSSGGFEGDDREEEESPTNRKHARASQTHDYSSSRETILGGTARGKEGKGMEKVVLGTSLRSLKPSLSSTPSPSQRGKNRSRGNNKRGGGGRGIFGRSNLGRNVGRIEERWNGEIDEEDEESKEAKLRRLYRSLG